MPTIVGKLTFMERINTTFERYEAVKRLLAWVSKHISFTVEMDMKNCFIISGPALSSSAI